MYMYTDVSQEQILVLNILPGKSRYETRQVTISETVRLIV